MLTARQTLGSYCFKISTHKILEQCNWIHIPHMIIVSSIKFIHKLFLYRQPYCLLNIYNLRLESKNSSRLITKYYPKIKSNIAILQRSLLYKAADIYNKIPQNILMLKNEKFNNAIKLYVLKEFEHDKIP